MLFTRKKSLDLILETAGKRSLTRQLGAFELTMLGIGAVIGTGIFVLTAVAANKAGPGMMYSFVIAGVVCALTALMYSESGKEKKPDGTDLAPHLCSAIGRGTTIRFPSLPRSA